MSTGEQDLETPTSTVDSESAEAASPPKPKLEIDVQISDVGPCKKHLKVSVAKAEIDRQFDESLGTMKKEAAVPGFRPGRAPRPLVEKMFRKQVAEQVKSTLLFTALEQIDEDYKLNPITQPNLDVAAIELPNDGPMRFEMEVEVRPDFPLPDYKGLNAKKPVKTISEKDVSAQFKLFLERYAQLVPKLEGGAVLGDFITADLRFHQDDRTLNEVKEIQFRLQPELRFQDGTIPEVGKALEGVTPGQSRDADAKIGSGSPDPSLRGQSIQVTFQVNDLKVLRLPEVDTPFLQRIGFDTEEEPRSALRDILQRRFTSQQRAAIRRDVMNTLMEKTPFDLPNDLVARQEKSTINRLVMDLKQEGMSQDDIRAREAEIRANAHESTLRGLKEFFLLAKIAEAEDIKVEDSDLMDEVELIAERTDESIRRVRSRIEKDGLTEALASQILERKTLDKILEFVTFEEVPLDEAGPVSTIDQLVGTETVVPEGEDAAEAEGEAPAADAEPSKDEAKD
jgi:trigger factor